MAAGFAVAYVANFLAFAKLLHLPQIPYPAVGAAIAITLLGISTYLTGEVIMRLSAHKSQNFQALIALAAFILGVCIGAGLRYLIFIRLLGFTEDQSPMSFNVGYLIGMLYHVILISVVFKLSRRIPMT